MAIESGMGIPSLRSGQACPCSPRLHRGATAVVGIFLNRVGHWEVERLRWENDVRLKRPGGPDASRPAAVKEARHARL